MRQFTMFALAFFLLTGCNNDQQKKNDLEKKKDQEKKKDTSSGFPPSAGAEDKSSVNPVQADNQKVGTGRFSIEAPEGWTKSDTFLMGNEFTFLKSPEEKNDDFLENINVVKENVGSAGLDEYYDKSLSMMKKGLTGFEEGESGNKTINGIEFKNLKYTHNYNGMLLDVDLYLAIHNRVGFVITCTAKKGKLSQYQPAFDQALRSFSFE
jgi:hypothetical protein